MVETDTETWDRIVDLIVDAESAGNDSKYGTATLLRERARDVWVSDYNTGVTVALMKGVILGMVLGGLIAILGMIA